jgi:hypothetical protein
MTFLRWQPHSLLLLSKMSFFGNNIETAKEETDAKSPEAELEEILKKILLESKDVYMVELEKVNNLFTEYGLVNTIISNITFSNSDRCGCERNRSCYQKPQKENKRSQD